MDRTSWLEKARGYLALGMYEEVLAELASLPGDLQAREETRELLIVIAMERGSFEEAFRQSVELSLVCPDSHAAFLQGAYCLHELQRTEDAIEHLQSGPSSLREEPVYFYNLGCYELALGKEETAMTWLRQSFAMDRRFRYRALSDPDLQPIRDWILDEQL